ncbi:MAG: cobalt-zinc-cadmium efflux system protein [Actinomycetota bacterium]|nr:cobalt-zinc-cadmium efflux system protein [Actinomycetota bacterium]
MTIEHTHRHDHHHATTGRARLAIVLALTSTVLAIQLIGAVTSGSLALLADAGHMFTDAAGLALALFAAVLAARPPTPRRTWGFLRAEVLAAGAQATVLLLVGGFVLVEGIGRLIDPPGVAPVPMAAFGGVGLVGNLIAVAVLATADRQSLNLRAAFLEVVNDALGSASVIVAALLISLTGWTRFDAVASLLIAVLIVPRTLGLLRESVGVLLESTPPGLDLDAVRAHILGVSHVVGVHDLHATLVATGLPVLTAHVIVDDGCFHDGCVPQLLDALQTCLAGHFDVGHSTFQIEPAAHAEHEHAHHA